MFYCNNNNEREYNFDNTVLVRAYEMIKQQHDNNNKTTFPVEGSNESSAIIRKRVLVETEQESNLVPGFVSSLPEPKAKKQQQ